MYPAYTFTLKNTVLTGLASLGCFDGINPSLVYASTGGRIVIHSPHQNQEGIQQETQVLNLNQEVISLCLAPFGNSSADLLFIGTSDTLRAYSVSDNSDVFYAEVADGLSAMCVGNVRDFKDNLALVGGNCSIEGFDQDGMEVFWTVTGGVVTAMCPLFGQGSRSDSVLSGGGFSRTSAGGGEEGESGSRVMLLVASSDQAVRLFEGEEVVGERSEPDTVIKLTHVFQSRCGFALASGTVGMYDSTDRLWRMKSKNIVATLGSFDLDGDGLPELVIGYTNGKLEVRSHINGSLVYTDKFSSSIAAIVTGDLMGLGAEQLVVVSTEGEVRGYRSVSEDFTVRDSDVLPFGYDTVLQQLSQTKQELMLELKNYEANFKKLKGGGADAGLIPSDTRVDAKFDVTDKKLDLVAHTSNEALVLGVVILAERMFDGESLFIMNTEDTSTMRVSLCPLSNTAVDLFVKVIVGFKGSNRSHIFELSLQLPRFAGFLPTTVKIPLTSPVDNTVTFSLPTRLPKLLKWVEANFFGKAPSSSPSVSLSYVSHRDRSPLNVYLDSYGETTRFVIQTQDVELISDMLKDLTGYLKIEELITTVEMPPLSDRMTQLMGDVREYNNTCTLLHTEIAEASTMVKSEVVQSENARLLADMSELVSHLQELGGINRTLQGDHTIRTTAHNTLMSGLMELNALVEKASKLRVGSSRLKVVSECRAAIKENQPARLLAAVRGGA
eukprot:GCRY01001590.1.p1 GENE.GCRY01001590.1~~GCRY01001590.1.p1  ORF type:complete len:724 (+),score=72.36 GCRY01001590.1:153-2324(+)